MPAGKACVLLSTNVRGEALRLRNRLEEARNPCLTFYVNHYARIPIFGISKENRLRDIQEFEDNLRGNRRKLSVETILRCRLLGLGAITIDALHNDIEDCLAVIRTACGRDICGCIVAAIDDWIDKPET